MSEHKGSGRQIEPEEINMVQRIDIFMTVISLAEKKFIDDLKFSFMKYGDRMYVTEGQMNWVLKLHGRLKGAIKGYEHLPAKNSNQNGGFYVDNNVDF